jgi:hypothetical protein
MKLETAVHEQWQTWQTHCDLFQRVFLDETGLFTGMIRRYGRARRRSLCGCRAGWHWRQSASIKIIEDQDIIEGKVRRLNT